MNGSKSAVLLSDGGSSPERRRRTQGALGGAKEGSATKRCLLLAPAAAAAAVEPKRERHKPPAEKAAAEAREHEPPGVASRSHAGCESVPKCGIHAGAGLVGPAGFQRASEKINSFSRRKRKGKKKKDRTPMNDVAPPLYGSGLPAVTAHAAHPPQQQRSDGAKLFELEPVRENVERRVGGWQKIRRPKMPVHRISHFLVFSLSLSTYNHQTPTQEHELRVETRPGHAVTVAVSGAGSWRQNKKRDSSFAAVAGRVRPPSHLFSFLFPLSNQK